MVADQDLKLEEFLLLETDKNERELIRNFLFLFNLHLSKLKYFRESIF